jgi:hypothetical protein
MDRYATLESRLRSLGLWMIRSFSRMNPRYPYRPVKTPSGFHGPAAHCRFRFAADSFELLGVQLKLDAIAVEIVTNEAEAHLLHVR